VEVPQGEPDSIFQGNIRGEFSVLYQLSDLLHLGGGFSWVSFPIDNDKELKEEHWNFVGFHGILGVTFDSAWVGLPLYVEGRVIERRIRPIEHRNWPIQSDNYIRYKPFPQYSCWGVEGVLGFKLRFTPSTRFDFGARVSALLGGDELTLSQHQLRDVDRGWTVGAQAGLVWTP
jgi:hypothetical protein